ncbi:MAG: hypothetical protein ABSB78_08445 [Bacteroidota bacterium]
MKSALLQIVVILLSLNFLCAKHVIRGTVIHKSTKDPIAGVKRTFSQSGISKCFF